MVDYGIDYIESRVAKKTDQIDKHRMNKYISILILLTIWISQMRKIKPQAK